MAVLTGAQIKAARKQLSLTQEQLAIIMGYGDKMRISELERGIRKPSPAAERLLTAYLDGYRPSDWEEIAGREMRAGKGAD